jgi:CRP/FNR family cyclic AMP-dependent transcriptional regulator
MTSAAVLSEAVILRLEKKRLIRMLHDAPAFFELFLHHVLSRSIRIKKDLIDQLFNSREKRLARGFLLLANFADDKGTPEPVIVKISQGTLAELVGTTRAHGSASS